MKNYEIKITSINPFTPRQAQIVVLMVNSCAYNESRIAGNKLSHCKESRKW